MDSLLALACCHDTWKQKQSGVATSAGSTYLLCCLALTASTFGNGGRLYQVQTEPGREIKGTSKRQKDGKEKNGKEKRNEGKRESILW